MKKYFIGMLALVLAVGFSAFTTKKAAKTFDTYYLFRIAQGNTTSPGDVQTLTNWDYVDVFTSEDQLDCDDAQRDAACEIVVNSLDTYVPVSTPELEPGEVTITAGQVHSSNFNVVTNLSTTNATIADPIIDRDVDE